jgi:NlpC/P60 family
MNKCIALCTFLLFAGLTNGASAQMTLKRSQAKASSENFSPAFINNISFTPDGILQYTKSESIKTDDATVVTNKNLITSVIDASGSIIETLTGLQFKYAMLLNVNVESLKNLSLFGLVDNWFGTKYRMGGTTKDGIDCSAFTSTLLSAVYGLVLPRTARQQYLATIHVTKIELKEGDLVFFNTHGGVSHVGLYLANNFFVHASKQGVVISSLNENYYSKRFICGGRTKED